MSGGNVTSSDPGADRAVPSGNLVPLAAPNNGNTSTFPPRCVRAMRPRPHPHAVRDSPMYVDCGTRAGQGGCVPTCDHSGPASAGPREGRHCKNRPSVLQTDPTAVQNTHVLPVSSWGPNMLFIFVWRTGMHVNAVVP
ncbi:MAG: hypothetical protein ACK53Y_05910, partial [bacterium]